MIEATSLIRSCCGVVGLFLVKSKNFTSSIALNASEQPKNAVGKTRAANKSFIFKSSLRDCQRKTELDMLSFQIFNYQNLKKSGDNPIDMISRRLTMIFEVFLLPLKSISLKYFRDNNDSQKSKQ